jgi:hypothetical protein
MNKTSKQSFNLSSSDLHAIAMLFMLCDHMWATVFPAQQWLTSIGRLAFPIFAFLAVEGYFHTHNFKCYLLRLLTFALISEIPFDLMYNGSAFYPFHQNVLWTILLGLVYIRIIEWIKVKGKSWLTVLTCALVVCLGWLFGTLAMVDYYGAGVLTILCFYFFRGQKWWCLAGQIIVLYWINVELLKGLFYPVTIFGMEFELHQQGLALLALIPIWLYRGRKGQRIRVFQYFCYVFYPLHILILVLLAGV